MLISENDRIADARIVRPIGKIEAASSWRAVGRPGMSLQDRGRLLRDLIRRAEDIDADAIVAVDYTIEPITREGGISMERVRVEGIAVRIALAA